MPNPHRKCPDCGLNHRPGNCRKGGVPSSAPVLRGVVVPEALQTPSRVTFVVDLTPVLAILSRIDGKLDQMMIAKQEIKPSTG